MPWGAEIPLLKPGGDGAPTRESSAVDNAAEEILLAAERHNDSLPVNLGTTHELSIKALMEAIAQLTGFRGEIIWDTTRPNGQPGIPGHRYAMPFAPMLAPKC
jgi:nucleoside-diphosphate-sugar epimerase